MRRLRAQALGERSHTVIVTTCAGGLHHQRARSANGWPIKYAHMGQVVAFMQRARREQRLLAVLLNTAGSRPVPRTSASVRCMDEAQITDAWRTSIVADPPGTRKLFRGSLKCCYIVNRPGIRSRIPFSANYDADPHER